MNASENFDEVLFQLERKIARRADELSRQYGLDRGRALEHWRQAEREVWESEAAEAPADLEPSPR